MILKTLVENTSISPDYKHKHGMCFYMETGNHKILFDLGEDGLFLENAKKMGIDISDIDTVIISHGHVDHGGALKLFLNANQSAKVYIRENAFDKHYTKFLGLKIDIGIDHKLKYHPQVVLTGQNTVLDDGLILFSNNERSKLISSSSNALLAKVGKVILVDDFSHEQSLVISENDKIILIAGCSHTGIVNIKRKAEHLVSDKITHVIGGFHLYNPASKRAESETLIQEIAEQLNDNYTHYYTCHCTGKKAYYKMKEVLSERLTYLSTGSEIEI